jgi:spermidine/putrescine transport system permease protein
MAVAVPADAVSQMGEVPLRSEHKRKWTWYVLPTYTALVILYLIFPIALMVLYSFNKSVYGDHIILQWQGFTTEWYHWNQLTGPLGLTASIWLSVRIALISTLFAVLCGTPMALALVRYKYRGRKVTDMTMFLNIAAPEIVMGAALLSLFVQANINRGPFTIFISHVMFNIAFVAVTVRARLSGYDLAVEEAAQDLYAGPWTTFYKVTLPLIFPGIMAGALLAFSLSIDDFVITNFVSGQSTTFPLWVFGATRVGIPPQVFAWGTVIFMTGLTLAIVGFVRQGRGVPVSGVASAAAPQE